MAKGNQAIPHVHQRKHWVPNSSQSGNIDVRLDQPKKKERRRRLRILKAKRVFPRPLRNLRPIVACPTVRYNMRTRLGYGFSVDEIRAAGMSPKYASTVGVRVDGRRKNISEEGLSRNVARLKSYVSKLVVFPVGKKRMEGDTADRADLAKATQAKNVNFIPLSATLEAARKVTKEERKKSAYKFLKQNISATRFLGARMKRAKKKADAEEEKKNKGGK